MIAYGMTELNVLYAFDNNYAPFGGTSILSLLMNNKGIDRIRIFVVLDAVSEENVIKLKKMVEEYKRELITFDAANINELLKKLNVPMYRGSYATHYRKFFHLFLPEDVEKLLYIDSDSIVPGNLEELINLDFKGRCIAVVLDALGGKYKKLLGFADCEPYFNAGVTYIDVKKWKERDYANKLISYIQNVRSKFCNPDQDLFNQVVKGDTLVIGPEYNFQPVHRVYTDKVFFKNYPQAYYYSTQELEHARQHPMIIHAYRYLGEFPWHEGNLHPDTPMFDLYLRRSEWADYAKKPSGKGKMFKIEKKMYTFLPRPIFLKIFKYALYFSMYKKDKRLKRECKKTEN